jgi:hypothetical protein
MDPGTEAGTATTGVVGNTVATGVGDCWGDTNAAGQVEMTSMKPSASTVSPRIGSGGDNTVEG